MVCHMFSLYLELTLHASHCPPSETRRDKNSPMDDPQKEKELSLCLIRELTSNHNSFH